jgi:hypothetical protein
LLSTLRGAKEELFGSALVLLAKSQEVAVLLQTRCVVRVELHSHTNARGQALGQRCVRVSGSGRQWCTHLERSEIKFLSLLDETTLVKELGVLEDGVAVVDVALYRSQKIVVGLLRCRDDHMMSLLDQQTAN